MPFLDRASKAVLFRSHGFEDKTEQKHGVLNIEALVKSQIVILRARSKLNAESCRNDNWLTAKTKPARSQNETSSRRKQVAIEVAQIDTS